MTETNICIAPKGKFRVVEVDERERRVPAIVRDCDTEKEARDIMKGCRGLNFERFIYDDTGKCVDKFRESKANEYLRYLNEGFGVYPWGETREND